MDKEQHQKGNIGFDPWLHSYKEIISLTEAFEGSDIKLVASIILLTEFGQTDRQNYLPPYCRTPLN